MTRALDNNASLLYVSKQTIAQLVENINMIVDVLGDTEPKAEP